MLVGWVTSANFSDAYHHTSIKQAHRKFLYFQVGEKRTVYLALPIGLSPAPIAFAAVMDPLKPWRESKLAASDPIPGRLVQPRAKPGSSSRADAPVFRNVCQPWAGGELGQVRIAAANSDYKVLGLPLRLCSSQTVPSEGVVTVYWTLGLVFAHIWP